MDISGLAFILMYNNSASPILLVCDPNHNVISVRLMKFGFKFLLIFFSFHFISLSFYSENKRLGFSMI